MSERVEVEGPMLKLSLKRNAFSKCVVYGWSATVSVNLPQHFTPEERESRKREVDEVRDEMLDVLKETEGRLYTLFGGKWPTEITPGEVDARLFVGSLDEDQADKILRKFDKLESRENEEETAQDQEGGT